METGERRPKVDGTRIRMRGAHEATTSTLRTRCPGGGGNCHQCQALRPEEMPESVPSLQSPHLLIRACDEPESFLLFRLGVVVFQKDR